MYSTLQLWNSENQPYHETQISAFDDDQAQHQISEKLKNDSKAIICTYEYVQINTRLIRSVVRNTAFGEIREVKIHDSYEINNLLH